MARLNPTALPPFSAAVAGAATGAVLMMLVPGGLSNALALLAAVAGLAVTVALLDRRRLEHREQMLVSLGEVKVKLAANSIKLDALAQRVELMPMRESEAGPARAALNELTAEVGLLGDLLQQVATTLADHDRDIAALRSRPAAAAAAAQAPPPVLPPLDPLAQERRRVAAEQARAAEESRRLFEDERARRINEALAAGQIEVHLQPVVRLPQRRTVGYEALVRLRLDRDHLLEPFEFLNLIEDRGFGPTLDALVLTRVLAIARHLEQKEAELFVACNLTLSTWRSPKSIAALARLVDKYRDHAGRVVVEMPQAIFRELDPGSFGFLGAMAGAGVRFALDEVADLRFDPNRLFDRGVRFVKVPAELLQEAMLDEPRSDIAVGDLAALLARASITLVAEDVTDNPTVADMLDLGVAYAQGDVFSPPRPIKAEIFAEPTARPAETVPAERSPAPAAPRPAASEPTPFVPPAPASVQPGEPRVPFRSVLRRASA